MPMTCDARFSQVASCVSVLLVPGSQNRKQLNFFAAFLLAVALPFCLCVVVFRCCAADTSFVEEKCSIRA